jgi:hypothetical protein
VERLTGVPAAKDVARRIFSVELAARQLIAVVAGATPERTGRFLAWNGATIPW